MTGELGRAGPIAQGGPGGSLGWGSAAYVGNVGLDFGLWQPFCLKL